MRHDIPELMSAADGYVMSSSTEGMPIVLLEAASSGLPIVATSVGGNPEESQKERVDSWCRPATPALWRLPCCG